MKRSFCSSVFVFFLSFLFAQNPPVQNGAEQGNIRVKRIQSNYPSVSEKPAGWFSSGQKADMMLSGMGFNKTGGGLLFNHPSMIATDETRLLMTDRNNNRILIWSQLPTENTPPDFVLGQPDFDSNLSGKALNQMNWPFTLSTAKGKLVVTDTYNDRILIWNSFPTRTQQPADLVLRGKQGPQGNIGWPWGVWTDGTRLAVSWTHGSQVHLWNSFPTQNDQAPDIVLTGNGQLGTPRNITSNGQYLFVGDHNPRGIQKKDPKRGSESCTFVWKSWPTKDFACDFILQDWYQGYFTAENHLYLLGYLNQELQFWKTPPESDKSVPDLTLGGRQKGSSRNKTASEFEFKTGDGSGVVLAGGRLYVVMSNGNRIVVYNTLPTHPHQKPDFAIGAPDIHTNTLETNYFITNPMLATDGSSLFVSSDFDRRLSVWNQLPNATGSQPDWIYTFPDQPWDLVLHEKVLILVGKRSVYLWTSLPTHGELPAIILNERVGSIQFQELKGISWDGKYFCLSDSQANKLYIWEGVPFNDAEPDFCFNLKQPGRLSSDGTHLLVIYDQAKIGFYNLTQLNATSEPKNIPTKHHLSTRFNLPGKAILSRGSLFVGDTCFSRVLIWKNWEDALKGNAPEVILGENNLNDIQPELGQDKLFWPSGLAFDGHYLWVGEFKFSGRILRFSVHSS